jgi:hypothetical protein
LHIFEQGELSESEDGNKNGGTGSIGEKSSEDGSILVGLALILVNF